MSIITQADKDTLILQLRKRIADFDTALSASLARENAYRETVVKQEQRIAELEAQLPKVVRPEKETDYPLSYWCDCDGEVFSGDVACRQCGAKLDWRTS